MKKQLYLFRHGQSEYNKIGRIQGSVDSPLTALGIEQAKRIPKYLKDKNLGIIYSSHLKRAWQTGEIVAKELGIDIIKNENLREDSSDILDGLLKKEAAEKFGDKYKIHWQSDDPQYDNIRFGKGESKIEVRQRMVKTISELSLKSPCSSIGFSSHGFSLKQMLVFCDRNRSKHLSNCEIIHFEFDTKEFINRGAKYAFNLINRIKTNID